MTADATAIITQGLRRPEIAPSTSADADALVTAASHHRVLVLLGSTLRAAGSLDRWPRPFVDAFHLSERRSTVIDCLRQAELTRVLDALAASAIRVLIFKGAALAHLYYPAPQQRARADTDLLMSADDVAALDRTLALMGYSQQPETSGQLVSYQSHYVKEDRAGVFHALDVHWKVSNRQAFADCVSFEELWDRRIPIPALGVHAATASRVDALILALVHRAAHHPGSRDLLWIYDLHVLAEAMTGEEVQRFADLAGSRGLDGIAREGLTLARDWYGTRAADTMMAAIDQQPVRRNAPSAPRRGSSQTDLLRHDLQALPSWRARWRLVAEHLFPAPSYMRAKYGVRSSVLLPALYTWRVVAGAPKWLRRGATR
ncbi:MAG TPA: nucleotidyltransferase family protein [Vicinamibacterales bacterium]|nr:nucleotidyltransferase family protein [Vicinamibacterales bacterium]